MVFVELLLEMPQVKPNGSQEQRCFSNAAPRCLQRSNLIQVGINQSWANKNRRIVYLV